MPRILPALAAAVIIAFSIGYNTARYPIVWEMVGPSAHLPEESGGIESAAASQPTKPAEPVASAPSDNPALTPSAELSAVQTAQSPLSEKNQSESQLSDTAVYVQAVPVNAYAAESSPPMTNLVAVPSDLFIGNGRNPVEQYPAVRRLPPVYQTAPIPAGRYAVEYPQSPISIYPSTGID